jgi:methylmalonyl-CoA mutase cobalamin-binding subunit
MGQVKDELIGIAGHTRNANNLREALESLGYTVVGMAASRAKAIAKVTDSRARWMVMRNDTKLAIANKIVIT